MEKPEFPFYTGSMEPRKIGLLLFDYGSEYALDLEDGILAYTESHNCTLYEFPVEEIGYSNDLYAYQNNAISSLISDQTLDGLLVASTTLENHPSFTDLEKVLSSFGNLPTVSIGAAFPGIPSVVSNPEPGFKDQITHLFTEHHCKRPLLFSNADNSREVRERTAIFRKCVQEYGIPFADDDIIYGSFTYHGAIEALKVWTVEHDLRTYDAIVCLNDTMAYAAIDYMNEHKIRLSQFYITGFDNVERAALSKPTLSTVDQKVFSQGFQAAGILLELIHSRSGGLVPPMVTSIDSVAIYRQSCGCIPLTDFSSSKTAAGLEPDRHTLKGVAEWYSKKTELLQIIAYQKNTQTIMALQELKTRINTDLKAFDISGAAICLYPDPLYCDDSSLFHLPDLITVFSAFDTYTGLSSDSNSVELSSFDPHITIVPENILYPKGKISVVPLYHGNLQFGYFVYRQGHYDPTIYTMLAITIASIVSSSKSFSLEEEKNRRLAEKNRTLNKISYTDEMTNILNRRGFMLKGQQAIHQTIQLGKTGMVIFGDMDHLKQINDTFGHEAGDRAIIAEAEILTNLFRSTDIVGRLGGDEFGIVAIGLDEEGFAGIQQRLSHMCSSWNEKTNESFQLSISLGAVFFSASQTDLTNLLKIADTRQYETKRMHRESAKKS